MHTSEIKCIAQFPYNYFSTDIR